MDCNKLYYGDKYDILREHIPDDSVDLIYIDPPFNSKRDYNVIYDGATAQAEAFKDTWSLKRWQDVKDLIFFDEAQRYSKIHKVIESFEGLLRNSNPSLFAYLVNISIRLVELHRVLKDTGSFYLHCDPTVSHYLKIVLDEIFGNKNFQNEIVWCYKARHMSKKHFGRKHDVILFYSKSDNYYFNWEANLQPLSPSTFQKYRYEDENGRYRLVGRGIQGSPIQSAKDVDIKWEIEHPELVTRNYIKEGYPLEDYWIIDIINQMSKERLGYPTQKPEALLEKIINASCPENGVVLDAYCGCGTSIAVAQRLNRKWIGIDITFLSIDLIRQRLIDTYYLKGSGSHAMDKAKEQFNKEVTIFGIPKDMESAKQLATNTKNDRVRKEFEKWAVFSVGGVYFEKKGADSGIDGYFYIPDKTKSKGLIQIKSGKVSVKDIREFNHVLDRDNSHVGIFVTLEEVTKPMLDEINALPKHKTPFGTYQKIYVVTIEDIFNENLAHLPVMRATKQAQAVDTEKAEQLNLL